MYSWPLVPPACPSGKPGPRVHPEHGLYLSGGVLPHPESNPNPCQSRISNTFLLLELNFSLFTLVQATAKVFHLVTMQTNLLMTQPVVAQPVDAEEHGG